MTNLDMDAMAEDGQKPINLNDVRALADKQLELEALVSKAESAHKIAKENLRKIQMGELPAALKAAGIPSFTLDNGMTVSYSEDLSVSVPKARKQEIIEQMKKWGYAPNINNTLTIDIGRDNDNAAKSLMVMAQEMGVTATLAEDVPTGTVKKALNARIKEGKNDDLPFFGAYSVTKATVK